MRNLFYGFMVLWITACATSYTRIPRTTYYVNHDVYAYDRTTMAAAFPVPSGTPLVIVGYQGDWSIFRAATGLFYIDNDALTLPDDVPVGADYSGSAPASGHVLYTGPRGGQYYINGNGNKTYVTPESTIDTRPIQTGTRGGQYYINDNGRKTYIKR